MNLDLRNICIVVAVAAVLPYLLLPSLPLIYDAERAIVANESLHDGSPVGVFGVDFWGESTQAEHGTRSWRPLVSLSWALQTRLFGESAVAFHLLDMLLHAGAAVLLVLLLAAWGVEQQCLLPSGLLFALHPVQSDAVASAVGRADIMAGVCLLGALVLVLRAPRSSRPAALRAGALGLIAAGMLCKEYAVSFPFVLVAVDLARRASGSSRLEQRRAEVASWVGGFALLGLYLLARVLLFGDLGGAAASPDFNPLAGQPWSVRWATSLALLPLALRLLLLPIHLNHHYRFGTIEIPDGLFDWRALLGLILLGALVAAAVAAARSKREGLPVVAVALFLLPLGPSLHVLSVVNVLFAERFLYIPVAGLAVAVAWALGRWAVGAAEDRAAVVLALVLVAFAGLTVLRVRDWRSMERLARSSLAAYPGGSDVWKQLGLALYRDGRAEQALEPLQRAVEINPRDSQAWTVYARALEKLRRYSEAGQALRKVVDLAPKEPGRVLREAGRVELLAGRAYEAVVPLERAHELMPADAETLHLLASAYLRAGRPQDAVTALRAGTEAMETDPDALRPLLGQALLRTAQLRATEGRKEDALFWTRQAVDSATLPPAGLFLAGLVAREAGDEPLASELLAQAQSLDPELIRKKHDAAVELTEARRYDEAIAQFEEILGVVPDHAPTLFNLGRALLLAGRPAEAIEPLERGLALQDDEAATALLDQARAATATD